jgi:hypothetical protein
MFSAINFVEKPILVVQTEDGMFTSLRKDLKCARRGGIYTVALPSSKVVLILSALRELRDGS